MTVIWPALQAKERPADFRRPGGASRWHTDLVHERQPAGVTHLHNDTIPTIGGDTLWASGYAAYEKLSPAFRKIIDGKTAIYRSAHPYLDRDHPEEGPKYVEREHPLVRVHPATGWKALWVNRAMTDRIVGFDKAESDVILGYLCDVYEKNIDIQVRFKWSPKTSALWDNRSVTCHHANTAYLTDSQQNYHSQRQLGLRRLRAKTWHKSHIACGEALLRSKGPDSKGEFGIVEQC